MPHTRLAYADYYDWLPYRTWSVRRLAARARRVAHARGAVILLDHDALARWRRGDFASPLQLQQAQIPQ